jgi:hypothetical protein
LKEKNKVIIVGSGSSNALAKIPTQKDFWNQLKNYIEKSPHASYFYFLLKKINNLVKLLNLGMELCFENDIEKAFSTLHDLTYSNMKSKFLSELALDMTLLLRLYIASWLRNDKYRCKYVKDKAGKFKEKFKPCETAIISLNFDELLEKLLKNYYHVYFDKDKNIGGKYEILKLHGSLSWWEKRFYNEKNNDFFTPRDSSGLLQPQYVKISDRQIKNYLYNIYDSLLLSKKENFQEAFTPVIIPFFDQKEEWYYGKWRKKFSLIYKRCAEVLSEADEIFIIGYSLPLSDWPIMKLLTGIADRNKSKKRKITVVNKSEFCELKNCKFCRIFGNEKVTHKSDAKEFYENLGLI